MEALFVQNGRTPLHWACLHGDAAVVTSIVSRITEKQAMAVDKVSAHLMLACLLIMLLDGSHSCGLCAQ